VIDKIINIKNNIENGHLVLANRFDGEYFGDKIKLLDSLFKNEKTTYVYIEIYNNNLDFKLKPIKITNDKLKFFIDNKNDMETFKKYLKYIEYIDNIYVFDVDLNCIFYANDNLEDVTFTIGLI
jgi:hypothetical protein